MQGFIDLLRLYAVLIDLFQIHLFLDTLAPCLMGADGLFDTGVVKQRPQLFGDKVDEKFGVKLLQFEVEGLCQYLLSLSRSRSRCAWLSSMSFMMGLSP